MRQKAHQFEARVYISPYSLLRGWHQQQQEPESVQICHSSRRSGAGFHRSAENANEKEEKGRVETEESVCVRVRRRALTQRRVTTNRGCNFNRFFTSFSNIMPRAVSLSMRSTSDDQCCQHADFQKHEFVLNSPMHMHSHTTHDCEQRRTTGVQ